MSLNLDTRIQAFSGLGEDFLRIASSLEGKEASWQEKLPDAENLQSQVSSINPWFTRENLAHAFRSWSTLLQTKNLLEWLKDYEIPEHKGHSKSIGVINAGNIPLVGMHDFLSVLICGHRYTGKNSGDDPLLMPYVAKLLTAREPKFNDYIQFSDRLKDFDAVIATGNNNSARYFDYYFSRYPHIIRKNRNGVAVLDGGEEESFLKNLGEDIFRYFGLGCRNVSKLYVPEGYNFNVFFEAIYHRSGVMQHSKYMNNFDHHNAIYLLKQIPFLQNGFVILKEDVSIASPIAVIHYEFYKDPLKVAEELKAQEEKIQCIVSQMDIIRKDSQLGKITVDSGQSQSPALSDYADGIDTVRFLLSAFS